MRLTVEDSWEYDEVSVTLDSEDVTGRCYEADEEVGYVRCFRLNGEDKIFILNGDVARETLAGKVVINARPLWLSLWRRIWPRSASLVV